MRNQELIEAIKQSIFLQKAFQIRSFDKSDFHLYLSDGKQPILDGREKISWLWETEVQEAALIGLATDGKVFSINDEGEFNEWCDSLADFPFAVLNFRALGTQNETTTEVFQWASLSGWKDSLEAYAAWAEKNGVQIANKYVIAGKIFENAFEE